MNWLNIELKFLRSEEYLGEDPVTRATWLNLIAYCADKENGGIIKDCLEWGDRKWMQLVGVTKDEVHKPCGKPNGKPCGLFSLNHEGDLVVHGYPLLQQQKTQRNRANGAKGGRPAANDTSTEKPSAKPCGSVSLKRNSNSKGNSNSKKKTTLPRFTPPAFAEVREYFAEQEAVQEAEVFYDHFSSNGWKVGGKATMKDWKAAARNWIRRKNDGRPLAKTETAQVNHIAQFKDWDIGGKHTFKQKHGISHENYADLLRVDLADLDKAAFWKKYKQNKDNVWEVLGAYGY